ncbi:MAG: hypothetical protein E3J54_04360, partial [Actinobacteria bacterium]
VVAVIVVASGVASYFLFFTGEKEEKAIVLNKTSEAVTIEREKPVRILVLGSDSRNSNIGGSRSDGNMLVQLNPDKSANIVSFPRDSYVQIAGGGRRKINSALATGGPEKTVKTVENYSGLKIDYYMVVSFPGFTGLVNSLGGVKFTFEKGLHDRMAGANFSAGTKVLKGGEALAVARSRHIAGGDFSRQANQQKLAIAALKQEQNRGQDMGQLLQLVPVIIKRVETDLSSKELFTLMRIVFQTDPDKIKNVVLQGGSGGGGGGSVVHLNRSYADKVFAEMKKK